MQSKAFWFVGRHLVAGRLILHTHRFNKETAHDKTHWYAPCLDEDDAPQFHPICSVLSQVEACDATSLDCDKVEFVTCKACWALLSDLRDKYSVTMHGVAVYSKRKPVKGDQE